MTHICLSNARNILPQGNGLVNDIEQSFSQSFYEHENASFDVSESSG